MIYCFMCIGFIVTASKLLLIVFDSEDVMLVNHPRLSPEASEKYHVTD